MEKLKSKRSIQEFWIDFLLEEELACSAEFAEQFVARCGFPGATIEEVVHSQSDQFGETDLLVSCTIQGGSAAILLIEDKINAAFQHQQAERYRLRGDAAVSGGRCVAYRTVLVAPDRYLGTAKHGFDVAIPLEHLMEWVCSNDAGRAEFKRARILRAIEKKNATGIQIVDEVMTQFRAWYSARIEEFNARTGTRFVAPAPRLAWHGDNWIQFKSADLPAGCALRHMSQTGIVDLTFLDVPIDAVADLESRLTAPMSLKAKGSFKQHSAIEVAVPRIEDFANLDAAVSIVELALDYAREMELLVISNIDFIRPALTKTQKLKTSAKAVVQSL